MGREKGEPGGAPRGREEVKASTQIGRQRASNRSVKLGLAWAGTKRTREPSARARALRRLVRRAGEARGTCRREPREWRAGDVSAPCPLLHLDPHPAHCLCFCIFTVT